MPAFIYKGFDEYSNAIVDFGYFDTIKLCEENLKSKKILNYEIYESEFKSGAFTKKRISLKNLTIFCKQMSVICFSEINIIEGVLLISEQSEDKILKSVLFEIQNLLQKNFSLTQSMNLYKEVFDSYLLNMISIGETSGNLDTVFLKLSEYYIKEYKMSKKIKSALFYPTVLSIMILFIVFLLILDVVPMFNNILNDMGGEISGFSKFMFDFSTLMLNNIYYLVLFLVTIFIFIFAYFKTNKGKLFFNKLKFKVLPIKKIYIKFVVSRFARSLALLLKSGVQILSALEEIKLVVNNIYISKKIDFVINEIKNGSTFSNSLKNTNIFPNLFLKMVTVGEVSGRLDEMLDKSSVIFDDEVEEAIKNLTDAVEPTLIIILSILIGTILISVMVPVSEIINSI